MLVVLALLPKLNPKYTNPRYQLAQVTEHCLVVPHICVFSVWN